ncbi:hypothetical protein BJ741DRAFT_171 [Chytriomyces cf. hyalinus JEL632]|nr:hypothetical protein BJ741DRAFT_171 [Chytriomyces cf. hyalinus JEL632]
MAMARAGNCFFSLVFYLFSFSFSFYFYFLVCAAIGATAWISNLLMVASLALTESACLRGYRLIPVDFFKSSGFGAGRRSLVTSTLPSISNKQPCM